MFVIIGFVGKCWIGGKGRGLLCEGGKKGRNEWLRPYIFCDDLWTVYRSVSRRVMTAFEKGVASCIQSDQIEIIGRIGGNIIERGLRKVIQHSGDECRQTAIVEIGNGVLTFGLIGVVRIWIQCVGPLGADVVHNRAVEHVVWIVGTDRTASIGGVGQGLIAVSGKGAGRR